MPATIQQVESPSPAHKDSDSAFFGEDFASEKVRTRTLSGLVTSTMHARTSSLPSVEAGADGEEHSSALSVHVPMRRVKSGTLKSKADSSPVLGHSNLGGQTQLLLQKMQVLEQKLNSMAAELKKEQVQRLHLEAKVVKLEEDNEILKVRRTKAGQQLDVFAKEFYVMTESLPTSPAPSPYPSQFELRSGGSRRDSVCSSTSSQSSRFSGLSF